MTHSPRVRYAVYISMGVAATEHPEHTHHSSPVHILQLNLVKCGICYGKVCLMVSASVTLVSHALTVKDVERCFVPYDTGTFLVTADQILQYYKKVSTFVCVSA